jgi:cytochrome c oxidase cbb3-type subunit 4
MFSFIRKYAETMTGAEIYPVISLTIFVLFFAAMLFYVWKLSSKTIEESINLPLED